MGHNSVVSGNSKSTGISWVDMLSMGPPRFRASHKCQVNQGNIFQQLYRSLLAYLVSLVSCCSNKKLIVEAEGKLANLFVLYGSEQDSGLWYMMSFISFHDMVCRIPYRIGMFLLGC